MKHITVKKETKNKTKIFMLTSNKNKFAEAKIFIPEIEMLSIDLDEIQEIDPHKVIKHKLNEAIKHYDNKKHNSAIFLVEDTSYYLAGMKGLPGPFAKWFEKTIELEGIAELTQIFGDRCIAKSIIGYYHNKEIKFFEGKLEGRITSPRKGQGFGWDFIFIPEGYDKTFSEMPEEKHKISMRRKAFEKLKEYLEKQ